MRFSPQRRAIFRHRNCKKAVRSWHVLYIFTSKCASRHSGVLFFWHRNFKKWSETLIFLTLWLGNELLATAACNFSTSELQKMLRSWRVLYIFTSKFATRHSGVHFFWHRNFKKWSETLIFFNILTWKCASRHSGVQFFDIGTAKNAPELPFFVHFHFKMCFSPQRSSNHMTPHPPL